MFLLLPSSRGLLFLDCSRWSAVPDVPAATPVVVGLLFLAATLLPSLSAVPDVPDVPAVPAATPSCLRCLLFLLLPPPAFVVCCS